jgi:membrane protein YqaA with SNARE-associated domain
MSIRGPGGESRLAGIDTNSNRSLLKRLYSWVLHWAEKPQSGSALFLLAFTESSFFPIPPDALLIPLAIAAPHRAFSRALVCTLGSVLGGMVGYVLGWQFMEHIGLPIIRFYGAGGKYEQIQALYRTYDVWAVGIAGFTPIPYKVFTIAAGAFKLDFPVFVLASAVSRGARFFLVAAFCYMFGQKIKPWIERYFNWLTIVFVILLIAGFLLLKYIW